MRGIKQITRQYDGCPARGWLFNSIRKIPRLEQRGSACRDSAAQHEGDKSSTLHTKSVRRDEGLYGESSYERSAPNGVERGTGSYYSIAVVVCIALRTHYSICGI